MCDTPNLNRVKAFRHDMQVIHDFLEDMHSQGYTLVNASDKFDFIPHEGRRLDEKLAEYFEFDLDGVERERQSIIDRLGE